MRFQFFIEASFIVDIKGWYVSWKRHYFFFFLVVFFQKGGLPFCGAVHTWCTGTSAWVSAHRVVFTLWVPYTVWLCRIVTPCQTRYWNMSLAARTKQWTAWNLQKLCAQRDPVPIFVPEFYRGYLKKGCVRVSAQRVSYLGRPCLGTKCSESCKMDRSSDLLRNTWPAYTFKFVITEKTLKRQEYLVASVNSLQSIQAWQETRLIFLITFFSSMLFCFPMNVFDLANFDFKCGPLF